MRDGLSGNRYERAFENWLLDHRIPYVRSDEHRRLGSIPQIRQELRFPAVSPAGPQGHRRGQRAGHLPARRWPDWPGLDCWVTSGRHREPAALEARPSGTTTRRSSSSPTAWRRRMWISTGMKRSPCGPDRYVFFCVRLDDYVEHMKRRSPKWRTVTLAADSFRRYAIEPFCFPALRGFAGPRGSHPALPLDGPRCLGNRFWAEPAVEQAIA